MTDQAMTTFERQLRGRLIRPGDADYDAVRALYNGMIDKRPRLIARCADVADVISAVNFAREEGLLLAIRGGGHSGPGLGSCDDGMRKTRNANCPLRRCPSSASLSIRRCAINGAA